MSAHGRARAVERQKSNKTGASRQEKGTHSASVDCVGRAKTERYTGLQEMIIRIEGQVEVGSEDGV